MLALLKSPPKKEKVFAFNEFATFVEFLVKHCDMIWYDMIWWDQVSTHLGAKIWGTLMVCVCVLVHCHVIMRWASGPQYIWVWNLLVCSSSSLLLWSKRQRPGSTLVLWHLEGSIFRGEEGAFQDYQSLVREEMCYSQTGLFWPKGF